MKIYLAIGSETGEGETILGIFSSSEKAIEFVQHYDQYLSRIDVEEWELDTYESIECVYIQIKNRDGLYFLTKDGFERPISHYNKLL
jgi:hypothetical protein